MIFNTKIKQLTIIFLFYVPINYASLGPDFLIIGSHKCGTTSLYNYIIQHPQIQPAHRKELYFFDYHKGENNFIKGIEWYQNQIPIRQPNCSMGEGSPEYFLHPLVPKRVFSFFPHVKLILILRNPTDSAFSQYKMNKKAGSEPLSFEQALDAEDERVLNEEEKIIADENYYSRNLPTYGYRKRGEYLRLLKKWLLYFPKEQFLILKSEELFNDPQTVANKVFSFLDLPEHILEKKQKHNVNTTITEKISTTAKKILDEYYKPLNIAFTEFLKQEFQIDISW